MATMTDLETSVAVVWPKWCYSSTNSAWYHSHNHYNMPISGDKGHVLAYGAKRPNKKLRRDLSNGVRQEENMSSDLHSEVKSERLSPNPWGDAYNAAHTTPSPSLSPKSLASNRTHSPSFPGTPPNTAFTPPTDIPYGRFSPAATEEVGTMDRNGFVGGLTTGHLGMKEMDALMSRSCSDLMRSLAAKYNNNNNNNNNNTIPNDQLGGSYISPYNGFLRSPLEAFNGFKHGSAPFIGVPTPPTTTTTSSVKESIDKRVDSVQVNTPSAPLGGIHPMPHLGAPSSMFPVGAGCMPGFPGFPLVEISSSQVLFNRLRNASTIQQTPLENYLRRAIKRPAESMTSPLDLSASVNAKRPRTDSPKSFEVKTVFGLQQEETKEEPKTYISTTRSNTPPKPHTTPSSGTHNPPTPVPVKGRPCQESIWHWTVDDVCSFVRNIELCSEYVETFRESRIDGSALPLLTEEHLTSTMNMKLGPALKLRSILERQMGAYNLCLQCDHCKPHPQDRRPASAS